MKQELRIFVWWFSIQLDRALSLLFNNKRSQLIEFQSQSMLIYTIVFFIWKSHLSVFGVYISRIVHEARHLICRLVLSRLTENQTETSVFQKPTNAPTLLFQNPKHTGNRLKLAPKPITSISISFIPASSCTALAGMYGSDFHITFKFRNCDCISLLLTTWLMPWITVKFVSRLSLRVWSVL